MNANTLRRKVARDIQDRYISFEQAMDVLNRWDVFGNWDNWELFNRPVDTDSLYEAVYIELYGY